MRRRRGGRARGRRSNNFDVQPYEFDLFVEDINGNKRIPNSVTFFAPFTPGDASDGDTTEITRYIFNEAIENFTGTFTDTDANEFGFFEIEIENPLTLDLTARYLPQGTVITLPDGITPVVASIDDGGIPINGVIEGDRLEYVITGNELEDLGITELALIIEDEDNTTAGFQQDGITIIEEVDIPNDDETDVNDSAIDDIEFIVDQGLLGFLTDIRVSGISSNDADTIVSTESDVFVDAGESLFTPNVPVLDLSDLADPVNINFTVSRDAGFDSTVGFYEVNADGSVNDPLNPSSTLAPGEEGYLQAALDNRLGISLRTENGTQAEFTETLPGGNIYAPFIVVNGDIAQVTDADTSNDPEVYFPFIEANSDGAEHITSLGNNILGFEDLPNGGDLDFNDIVVEYEFV